MQLGFSVYLSETFDEDYIERMLSHGFKYLFTSLQIPEEDASKRLERLAQLAEINAHRAQIIVDVNGQTFDDLGFSLKQLETIKDAGIDIIRFDILENVDLIAEYVETGNPIMLNASTNAFQILRALNDRAISVENVYVAHNYYPRPNTGLDKVFFEHINERLKGAFPEVNVMAFVPGTKLRGPLYRGLPTLEDHRLMHPLLASYELELMLCDIACIGDSQINPFMMEQFNQYHLKGTVLLRTDLAQGNPYAKTYHNRPDVSRDVVRAVESRQTFTEHVTPSNTVERPKGTITLDNERYARYMNELQITRTDLPDDAAVNVLGHVQKEDRDCIRLIQSGTAFSLREKEEDGNGF